MTDAWRRLKDHQIFLLATLVAVILPAVGYAVFTPEVGWFVVFPLILLSLASAIIGGLFGFLFGIPRHSSKDKKKSPAETVDENTNLYDVSDWLTKIIVGVGLIQIKSVSAYFFDLVNNVDTDLKTSRTICSLLILGSFVIGFFMAYFWARFDFKGILQSAFERVDQKIQTTNREVEINRAEIQLSLYLLEKRINPSYKMLPSEFEDHIKELDRELHRDPLNRRAVILRARYGAKASEELESLKKAITILNEFVIRKKSKSPPAMDDDYADALYNMACYLIIQRSRSRTEAEKDQIFAQAMNSLQESVMIKPTNRADAKTDQDFSPIYAEPRFLEITA